MLKEYNEHAPCPRTRVKWLMEPEQHKNPGLRVTGRSVYFHMATAKNITIGLWTNKVG
jgi:hypothetical protein